MHRHLEKVDPEILSLIVDETQRQKNKLELIASENFVSAAVLEAMGSRLPISMQKDTPVDAIMAAANM